METSPPKHSVSLFSLPRLPALSYCTPNTYSWSCMVVLNLPVCVVLKLLFLPFLLGIYRYYLLQSPLSSCALSSVYHSKVLKKDMLLKLELRYCFCKGKLTL